VLIDAGAMGLTNNRPYAMNAVIPPSTRLMGTKLYAPPHDVTSVRPKAPTAWASFDSGHRRQEQADASKKLTDPDEDEQVLRRRGKPGHFLERLVPQGRLIA